MCRTYIVVVRRATVTPDDVVDGNALIRSVPWLYAAIAFTLPFSLRLYFSSIDLEVIFPAEPLIAVLAIVLAVQFIRQRAWRSLARAPLRDTIVVIVLLWSVALLISACTSSLPMVSAKAVLVKGTFILVFFLFPVLLPSIVRCSAPRLFAFYGVSFTGILLYSLFQQSESGFDRNGASLAPFPFYVDHTSYSAALVFILLMLLAELLVVFRARDREGTIALALVTLVMAAAFYLAYCRAAWISVLAVAGLVICARSGMGLRRLHVLIVALGLLAAGALTAVVTGKLPALADSNASGAGLKESVLSLTNTRSDTSNRERINRWKSAVRMFRDEPIWGHGVGTFQFAFLPYQREDEMTYISVTGPVDPGRVQRVWSMNDRVFVRRNPQILYCSGGTAHSEYLLALSESGIMAALLFAALAWYTLRRGLPLLDHAQAPTVIDPRRIAAWLAVLAYFVHAGFNNFLDDPKVAFLFWTSLAMLVHQRPIRSPR